MNVVIPKEAPTIIRTNGIPNSAGYFLTARAKGLGLMGLDENAGMSLFLRLLSPY